MTEKKAAAPAPMGLPATPPLPPAMGKEAGDAAKAGDAHEKEVRRRLALAGEQERQKELSTLKAALPWGPSAAAPGSAASGAAQLRVYDMRDLLQQAPKDKAAAQELLGRLGLLLSGTDGWHVIGVMGAGGDPSAVSRVIYSAPPWADVKEQTMLWWATSDLMVRTWPEIHTRLEEALLALRAMNEVQGYTETKIVHGKPAHFAAVAAKLAAAGGPFVTLSDKELTDLFPAFKEPPSAAPYTLPSRGIAYGEETEIVLGREFLRWTTQAALSTDRRVVELESRLFLGDVLPKEGVPFTWRLPVNTWGATLTPAADGGQVLVLLRAKVVAPEEAKEHAPAE
jgi:hypothetical protein